MAAIVLDIGGTSRPQLQELARQMDEPCIPLPRADAGRISEGRAAELADVR